jgi:hypothetical protein
VVTVVINSYRQQRLLWRLASHEEALPRHPFGGGSSPWIVAKTERD